MTKTTLSFGTELESNIEPHGTQGQLSYEEARQYGKRLRYDALFQILEMHFPTEYHPEIFEQPEDIPPQGGDVE
ncbi:hypothetical protein MKW98_024173 [Papaver atlanticum]|uniref:Uncharacterized protein n=1 Tax=Papaver atlanticum TaxID=357466 RepID=A0AAD4SYB2_9MAGN|nr:hypothetical protein MKW98_024173 [Papaver atlanticum]